MEIIEIVINGEAPFGPHLAGENRDIRIMQPDTLAPYWEITEYKNEEVIRKIQATGAVTIMWS